MRPNLYLSKILLLALGLLPAAAWARGLAPLPSTEAEVQAALLTPDDIALWRASFQALEVAKAVSADADTLAYLGATARANLFRLNIRGLPWLLKVAKPGHANCMAKSARAASLAARKGWGPQVWPLPQVQDVLLTAFVEGAPLAPTALGDASIRRQVLSQLQALHSSPCDDAPMAPSAWVDRARKARKAFADAGRTGPIDEAAIEARLRQLDSSLANMSPAPCMSHQDVWHGNLLRQQNGEITLVGWGSLGCGEALADVAKLALMAGLPAPMQGALLSEYLQRPATAAELERYATLMGILEIDAYYTLGLHGDAAPAMPPWQMLVARLQASLERPFLG